MFHIFHHSQNFFQASKYIPDISVIRAVQKIVWASGCGNIQLVFSSNEEINKIYEKVKVPKIPGKTTSTLPKIFNQFYKLNVGVFSFLAPSHSLGSQTSSNQW